MYSFIQYSVHGFKRVRYRSYEIHPNYILVTITDEHVGVTSNCKILRIVCTYIITSAKQVMFSLVFVCLFVCLLVSRITQKLLNRFSQNSAERRHMNHRRNDFILAVIRIWIRIIQEFIRNFYRNSKTATAHSLAYLKQIIPGVAHICCNFA